MPQEGKDSKRKKAEEPKIFSKDYVEQFAAACEFVEKNAGVESSSLIESTITELGACSTILEVFETPIRNRLFNMDTAINWVFFLSQVGKQVDEEPLFVEGKNSIEKMMDVIGTVFDLGVSRMMDQYFEDNDTEDEDEDEDEGEGGPSASSS